ncbi:MAG TPA: ASCH domain-containing protein, partial [Trebonia sp.]
METGRLGVGEFAFPGPLRDQLVAAILDGTKTTTTGLLDDYERDSEPLPRPGDREVVIDSAGHPVAVVEIAAVRVIRVGDVDLAHAVGEGEGYASVADWRAGHEDFWHSAEMRASVGDPAFTVAGDTLAVALEFHLVHDEHQDLTALLQTAREQTAREQATGKQPAREQHAARPPALIPSTTRPLPLAVAAKGARIFDEAGLDYIDASS